MVFIFWGLYQQLNYIFYFFFIRNSNHIRVREMQSFCFNSYETETMFSMRV